ncbi:MAG: hypothetical protein JWL73_1626 [Actinomycetia bacterium]|nr:hypothetical protein [Actinomycetes bacterium]
MRFGRRKDVMHISEAQLTAMTANLDGMHQQALPEMHAAVSKWSEKLRDGVRQAGTHQSSRRGFLVGSGVALGGVALAACGGTDSAKPPTTTTSAGKPPAKSAPTAVQVGMLAAALENTAVLTYATALKAAQSGKLGPVPPAISTFITTVMQQHQDHADAWNAALPSANKVGKQVDTTVMDLVVTPAIANVKDIVGVATLALQLENAAAATYQKSLQQLQDVQQLQLPASIQPVEMQHAAILSFVLGQYPVPDAFSITDAARPTTDHIGNA